VELLSNEKGDLKLLSGRLPQVIAFDAVRILYSYPVLSTP